MNIKILWLYHLIPNPSPQGEGSSLVEGLDEVVKGKVFRDALIL